MAVRTLSDWFEAFMRVTYCNSYVADPSTYEANVHVAGEQQARGEDDLRGKPQLNKSARHRKRATYTCRPQPRRRVMMRSQSHESKQRSST